MKKRKGRTTKVLHKDGTESDLERKFLHHWTQYYPRHRPRIQYRFHQTRLWTFDFAWVHKKVAVEIQGMGPGHCSLKGMTQDYDKNLAALRLGWRIVYLTTTHLSPRKVEGVCQQIAGLLSIPTQSTTNYVPVRRRYGIRD